VCEERESPPRASGGPSEVRNNKNDASFLFCTSSAQKSITTSSPSTSSPTSRSRSSRQLEILAIRALDLADQVADGQVRFLDAVDLAYEAAVWAGLVKAVGDDIVQATLAAAFANARRVA
jgi:hypothetical protein